MGSRCKRTLLRRKWRRLGLYMRDAGGLSFFMRQILTAPVASSHARSNERRAG